MRTGLDIRRQQTESTQEDKSRQAQDGIGLRTIWLGGTGGALATVAMTVFRLPISGSLPPTSEFYAQYIGSGDAEDYLIPGLILHLLYGIFVGVVFAIMFVPRSDGDNSEAEREVRGILWSGICGSVLSVFGARIVLEELLGMELARDERLIFHVSHLIYGMTLGAWLGSNA